MAMFDIVLGRTVEEIDDGTLGWGLGKPEMRFRDFGRRRRNDQLALFCEDACIRGPVSGQTCRIPTELFRVIK